MPPKKSQIFYTVEFSSNSDINNLIWCLEFVALLTLGQEKHIFGKCVCLIITEWQSNDFIFFCAVKKTSTDALQLVVERCAAASIEGPCEQMITVLR